MNCLSNDILVNNNKSTDSIQHNFGHDFCQTVHYDLISSPQYDLTDTSISWLNNKGLQSGPGISNEPLSKTVLPVFMLA